LFSERGFEGTRVREICKLAGVNVAAVCYYFRSKQRLYEAVQARARDILWKGAERNVLTANGKTPRDRLQAIIESLFARLSEDSGWIAQLVVRELAGETGQSQHMVNEGLRSDLILIESVLKKAYGPEADASMIHLAALGVVSQCVFYCAARRTLMRVVPELDRQALRTQTLVHYLTDASLQGLGQFDAFSKAGQTQLERGG
jgi:AcrR family transcriptional regulator